MKGFVGNIEEMTEENENFRKVLFTGPNSQLVVMSLQPDEDIGMEKHMVDQFIRIEDGEGKAILGGEEYEIEDDWAVVIPAGVEHNIINTGSNMLKLYSIYSPAEHPDRTVHATKSEAMENE
jgi:mannose-6-phosphate isomerase-like protein (cupin superfamily)